MKNFLRAKVLTADFHLLVQSMIGAMVNEAMLTTEVLAYKQRRLIEENLKLWWLLPDYEPSMALPEELRTPQFTLEELEYIPGQLTIGGHQMVTLNGKDVSVMDLPILEVTLDSADSTRIDEVNNMIHSGVEIDMSEYDESNPDPDDYEIVDFDDEEY